MRIRSCLFSALLIAALAHLAHFAPASAASARATIRFDLPAQALEKSLRSLGKSTDMNILIDRKLVSGLQAPALTGELTVEQAITRLLAGTGLTHQFLNEHTVVLAAAGEKEAAAAQRIESG